MATTPSPPPSATTMRAVQYDGYGGGAEGLKHVEVPIPSPKKGEVLIKMEAASINPIDWKIQKGMLRPFLPWKFPSIPACDLAGKVAAVGGGVRRFELGDKVIAINFPSGGGFAEYAVAQASLTVERPPEVSAAEGPFLPLAAVTALQALRARGAGLDKPRRPKDVRAGRPRGYGHLRRAQPRLVAGELGADEALDYATPDGAALRSPSGRRYDAVVHCAPHLPWQVFDRVLAEGDTGGVVVDITPSPAALATALLHRVTFSKKRLTPFMFSPSKADMELLVAMARQGKLKPAVDSCHPLSDATGKVVVKIGEEE
ncbi:hypothetical protein OsJ_29918 [Oryza sativa Japonica Group]|uniref:Enoyl reductase (ER) domain-containing protein n=1 Tax=Oryza sativa subsp. japonica TaxID=39947 RepID=B9G4F4_ORYSJ|nr:hypothetical protein OsJ_29918 [Oryza sativa Japonica Group]